jgi:hypothetical protein
MDAAWVDKLSIKKEICDLKEKKKLLGITSFNEEKLNVKSNKLSPKKKKKHQKTNNT